MEKPLTEQALATIDPLNQALALAVEAGDIPAMHDIASMAAALQKGARARGLGISAENQAAEIVLRAERAMGISLDQLAAEGALVARGSWRKRKGQDGEMQENIATRNILQLQDLGLNAAQAFRFRLIGRVTDEAFEALLRDARAHADIRLAKVNFYRAAPGGKTYERVTPEDKDFGKFRDGAYALLGMEVHESGVLIATKNGLSQLPNDELTVVRDIIEAMTTAYNIVRYGRRGG